MTEKENTLIEAYLLGTATSEEKAVVEAQMVTDDRFRESVMLQKSLLEALDQNYVSTSKDFNKNRLAEYEALLRDKKTQQLKETLKAASTTTVKVDRPHSIKWIMYAAAAVVVCVLTFNVLSPSSMTTQELYASNLDLTELPSLVVRGNANIELEKAQLSFENGDYEEALPLFTKLSDTATSNVATLLVYKGIAEMELGTTENARATFDKLTAGDYLDASKGIWYNAMLSLKVGNKQAAKEYLERIVKSTQNYKYNEAKELLEEL